MNEKIHAPVYIGRRINAGNPKQTEAQYRPVCNCFHHNTLMYGWPPTCKHCIRTGQWEDDDE